MLRYQGDEFLPKHSAIETTVNSFPGSNASQILKRSKKIPLQVLGFYKTTEHGIQQSRPQTQANWTYRLGRPGQQGANIEFPSSHTDLGKLWTYSRHYVKWTSKRYK